MFRREQYQVASSPIHCSFSAVSKKDVLNFDKRGLVSGGTDNGGPSRRGYYAACLIDLNRNNIEAGYGEQAE